ncbi:MAG: hypothetical protein JSW27_04365 [Phycisphaerales bacterium]|nr:MAG: hypothetical protein JSW27_04365 [Phycisphaerales bacterium]
MLFRFVTVLVVLVVAFVLVAAWVARALPGIAVGEISRLTNTRIEMGAFDFHRDVSVSIDGIVVRPEAEELFYDDTILRAKTVSARFSLGSILRLAPEITEIRIDEFFLDVQCDLDTGRWNVSGLKFNAGSGRSGARPRILLEGGKLRYYRVSGGKKDEVMSVPVEARFESDTISAQGYSFELKTSKQSVGYGESALRGSWRPGRFELAGGLSSTDIPSFERAWAVDLLAAEVNYDETGQYDLTLRVKELHSRHSPEVDTFRMMTPEALRQSGALASVQRFFARYRPFGTVGEIQVDAHGHLDELKDSEISGRITCNDISIHDRKFPYAIDHLAGTVDFTQSMAVINELSGKHGDVDVTIEGWCKGFGDERQYRYQVTSDRMTLDEDLYAALKPEQKRLWESFQPSGSIAVNYRLTRSVPFDKRLSLVVDLNDVTATYQKFPYPLSGLTGQLRFDRESIVVSQVLARRGGGQIRLNGKVTDRDTERPMYYITIDGNDLPLDTTLRDALPEPYRELYGHFDVNGVAGVQARVFTSTDANSTAPFQFLADVSLEETSLRMEGLPLPIADISAEASVTVDSASIKKSSGRYGQGQVSLTGGVRFGHGERPNQYRLKIETEETLVDQATIEALPESIREPVSVFQPEGLVNLAVDIRKADSNAPPDYSVTVECLGDKINHERFPYPLRDIQGHIVVDPGGVTLIGVTAKPDQELEWDSQSVIQIDGHARLVEGRPVDAGFALQGRDVLFTDALGQVLPMSLQGVYRDLSPRGPFDINLPTLKIGGEGANRGSIEFDGQLDLKTCSLHVSGAGTEVDGTLAVAGLYEAERGFSSGRVHLAADRLTIRGKDVTKLNADIVYDPNAGTWSAHNFLGHCYDGKVLGDFLVEPLGQGVFRYLVTTGLNRVDLRRFLLAGKMGEAVEKDYSSGILNAAVSLGARVGDGSSRLGVCRVDVTDMQVGKMSPLANLLAVLRLTEPSDYAFDRMLIESYLRRNRLLISRFDMSGKNLAFTGGGTMDLLDEDVDLTLTARGKRVGAAQPSLFQSLTEGLGGAVMRVEVTGKADDPHVETKALPVIEDSLKILGTPQ